VGLYSSAMTLARLLLVGNGALTYIYLPVAARLKREGAYDAIRSTYVTGTRWILAITIPMFFLFAFLPALSLRAVFGSLYTGGAVALDILVIGSFLSVIEGPANSCLAGMGYARSLLLTTILSAMVNLVLSFALIPTFGLVGAAVAWAVARAIYPGVGAYLLWRSDRITPFRPIFTIPLAVTLLVGCPIFFALRFVHLSSWTVVPLFFLGTLIYIGAVLATRSVERGDLVAFRALQKRLGWKLPRLDRFMERYLSRAEAALPHS
jgi:O-antigen/teichoic acid export membrane protein